MKYTIYTHIMVDELNDIDRDDQPSGATLLYNENEGYAWMLDPDIRIRFLEKYKKYKNDPAEELHFEVWIDFEAKNDDDAIKKAEKVMKKKGFDWQDIYFILYMQECEKIVLDHTDIYSKRT